MKRLLTTVLIFFLLACSKPAGMKIEQINDLVKTIENELGTYQFKEFNVSSIIKSTEGADMLAYYKGTALQKITVSIRGEIGFAEEMYYYKNDTLQFAQRTETRVSEPFGNNIVSKSMDRYFFEKGNLFAKLDSLNNEVQISPDIQKQVADLINTQFKYIELTNKKTNEYMSSDYSFVLSQVLSGFECKEDTGKTTDADFCLEIYNTENVKVGQIRIYTWNAAMQLAIGDTTLKIDGEPALKKPSSEMFGDYKVTEYSFESSEIIVKAKIITDLEDWFEKNFHFIRG